MACGVEDAVAGAWDIGASPLSLGVDSSPSPALTFLVGFSFWFHVVTVCVSGSSSFHVQVW